MRTLAIDLGTRRVGLAISDEGGRFATPLDVLSVKDASQAIGPILQIILDEDIRRVVIGLPLNMDGTIGPAARATISWAHALEKSCVPLTKGTQLFFVDERLSSFDAEQQIVSRKRAGERISRNRKKQSLDALAATSFLQAFLDGKLQPIDVSNQRD